jgi:dipeptidyl aminopeptidase/acylaminoacyl peptidase
MTPKINPRLFAILLIPLLAGAACGTPVQTPTQVAQATEITIPSTTPLPEPATPPPPTPTSTPLPSGTPTRTPAPSATPTATVPPPSGLIAFTRREADGNQTLWWMNPDGSQLTRWLEEENIVGQVLWSPDGQKMAYFTVNDAGSDIGDLKVFERASGEIQTIIQQTDLQFWSLRSWSPDGHYLVLGATTGVDTALKVVDVAQRQTVIEQNIFLLWYFVFFSPDSNQLVLVVRPDWPGNGLMFDENTKTAIQCFDFTQGQFNTIVEELIDENSFEVYAWLPDGRILFNWRTVKNAGDDFEINESLWTILPGVDDEPQPAQDYPLQLDQQEVRRRMPEDLRAWWYSFSSDGNWFTLSNKSQIYLVSWETGAMAGPLVEGDYPVWLPEE